MIKIGDVVGFIDNNTIRQGVIQNIYQFDVPIAIIKSEGETLKKEVEKLTKIKVEPENKIEKKEISEEDLKNAFAKAFTTEIDKLVAKDTSTEICRYVTMTNVAIVARVLKELYYGVI